jgi:hypothetical protein
MAAHIGDASIPLSVIVAVFDRTPEVSEQVIADDRVAAVTLTGSTVPDARSPRSPRSPDERSRTRVLHRDVYQTSTRMRFAERIPGLIRRAGRAEP